ncbi:Cdc42 rho gtpase-activating protein [Balamuthia mandrillaris]
MQAAPLSQEELAHLVEKTKYTAEELKALHEKHNFHEAGGIHRDEFEKVLADMFQVDVNKDAVLISRLFEQFDADHNGIIDFQEFATGLSMIYSEDPKDKLAFVFSIFDLDGDGKITKNEFTAIVQTLWQNDVCQKLFDFAIDDKQITGVRVFVEHFFHEADLNKDGVIDWNEFQQVASKYAHAKPDHKLQVMTHQTGGHVDAFKVLEGGKIRKSVSLKEYSFMIPYAPTLYQVEEQGDQKYVIMEDLTAPFKKPCVADFKIGITSAGEDASPEKREAMRKKDMESTTVSLGMRITGMKVWDVKKGDYVRYTKTWGRDVTIEKTKEAVSLFFHNGERVRKEIVALALEKATAILEFMKNQRHSRFYSSSLLFLYDGDTSQPPALTLKMIDFAHVHPIKDGGLDDGYIFGVTNLLHHLEEIEKEASA